MSTQFAGIAAEHRAFIARQKIFFVASAAPTGRVSVSPKGMSAFRVLGDNDAAYLDCTGSGSETRAHLMASDDRRLTIMFCAFDGKPVILRLYGQAESLMRGTPGYDGIIHLFDEMPGARQIGTAFGRPRANLVRIGRSVIRLQGGQNRTGRTLDGTR